MPRLTNQKYLAHSAWLRGIWFSNLQSLYSLLPAPKQWDLHAYFAPTKDWSDAERIQHRKIISRDFPDLPAQAGRYYSAMRGLYDEAIEFANENHKLVKSHISHVVAPLQDFKNHKVRIGVALIAKPEPDLRRFVRALIMLVEDEIRKEEEGEAA